MNEPQKPGCSILHYAGVPGERSLLVGVREEIRSNTLIGRMVPEHRLEVALGPVKYGVKNTHSHLLDISHKMNYNVIHGRCRMPANSLVQTRINAEIKEEASTVLRAIGLTVSDAVRLMLTRVAREKALPFEPLIPNDVTIAAMKEARERKLETVTLDDLQAVIDAND